MAKHSSQDDLTFPFVIHGKSTPHIADRIFQLLDRESLVESRLVSNSWKNFIDNKTPLWGELLPDDYIDVVRAGRLDLCRLIIKNNPRDYYGRIDKNPPCYAYRNTPLHHAAELGLLEVCQLIMDNIEAKNPSGECGFTPLHWAAEHGQVEVCRLIMENIKNKNPGQDDNITPLHRAAENGRVEVCRLIMDNVVDGNPADDDGDTPLHYSARQGHLEVCALILDNIKDESPRNINRATPLDLAEEKGHLEVVQLFQKHRSKKVETEPDEEETD